MEDDPHLAALRQRLAIEIANANLNVIACQEQVARSRDQLAEARALLAETRARLSGAYRSLEAVGSVPWTTLPKQQPEQD